MNAISIDVRDSVNLSGIELDSYDTIIVAFSGGKDSLALVLLLLELGVPKGKIELAHHDVDGDAGTFMDWPITPAYCRAVAAHLGLPIYFSWKEGGFEREMLRCDEPTAPIRFENPDGTIATSGGNGPNGTRQQFPQVSANLSVRWCSAYLKIDVLAAVIRNSGRFQRSRTLVLTGERAEESPARAKYQTFEPHRSDLRDGARNWRVVDAWRPIHKWSEQQVWAIIERWGIVPHPGYSLGWARLSCRDCIFFSSNQAATSRAVFPASFARVRDRETQSGKTIKRKLTMDQTADRGTPYPAALANPDFVALADSTEWTVPIVTNDWRLPAGAFAENAGPC